MPDLAPWLNKLGLWYVDYNALWTAFTHRSYKGSGYNGEDNERFEFLGDAVLDIIIAKILFEDPDLSESEMTEIRKMYVSNDQLAVIFDLLDMRTFIRTAKNMKLTKKVKAGVVEAIFGVVFNQNGLDECFNLWNRLQAILSGLEDFNYQNIYVGYQDLKNAKSTLLEFCQDLSFEHPEYKVVEKFGPDHAPEFKVKLILRPGLNKLGFEEIFESYSIKKPYVRTFGFGQNKKSAEMEAAEEMCERVGLKYVSTY